MRVEATKRGEKGGRMIKGVRRKGSKGKEKGRRKKELKERERERQTGRQPGTHLSLSK
jgi:hypothetical protein